MYSKLLDQDVFVAVLAAAPPIRSSDLALASDVLTVLEKETHEPLCSKQVEYRGEKHYEMRLGELTSMVEQKSKVGQVTPRLLGYILGQLGIERTRRRDGYCVVWSIKQVDLLHSALGGI